MVNKIWQSHFFFSVTYRLAKLSLAVLGVEELDAPTSDTLASAKSKFRLLARLLHPDKCFNPNATDAFAVVKDAMSYLSVFLPSNISKMSTPAAPITFVDEQSDGLADPAEQAKHAEQDMAKQLTNIAVPPDFSSVTWNQSRLVVTGHVVPHGVRSRLPSYYRPEADGSENSDDIIFLPLAGLPTLSRSPPETPAFQNVLIESMVENMLQTLEAETSHLEATQRAEPGQIPGVCEEVEGLLLVTCRHAMHGKFPLNGTYFQINEVFLDHSTTSNPLQLPRRDLVTSKRCQIYFGLGIHYLAKAMNQNEVAHMFSNGWVCFRAFDLEKTRAPRPLPQFLMPSIPSNNKSAWKNKAERLAAQGERSAAAAIRAPGVAHQISAIQESSQTPLAWPSALDPPIPVSTRDSKSGKGRTRSYIMPVIPAALRCGSCKACLNPAWKKACETRRAEVLLEKAGGPYVTPPGPGAAHALIDA